MASVTWSGLVELQEALRQLPAHLTEEAGPIVERAATEAMNAMDAAYPPGPTGELRRGLKKQEKFVGPYGVGYRVVNTSKLAWIFENGTVARHNRFGANRGSMPPGHVVVPAAERSRAAMYAALRAMLVREGLIVSGNVP